MYAVREPSMPALPPTQDELPYEDGMPMETPKHRDQMNLLIDTLRDHLADRADLFIGGNMGVYYSVLQARNRDFLVPDVFVAPDVVPGRHRKSWVIWEEDGRAPRVVIELLSDSTESYDRTRKMQIYAGLGVQEYYLFDPHDLRLEGFRLRPPGQYEPIVPNASGRLECESLALELGRWPGPYEREPSEWLRWFANGVVCPTGAERAEAERGRAEAERGRAERLAARLRALGLDPDAE